MYCRIDEMKVSKEFKGITEQSGLLPALKIGRIEIGREERKVFCEGKASVHQGIGTEGCRGGD